MQKNFVIFIDFSRFLSQTCIVFTIGNHMQLWQNDTGIFFCNVAATGSWKDKNHAHSFIFGAKKGMTSCDSYVPFWFIFSSAARTDVLVSFSMKKFQLFLWISNVHLNFWYFLYTLYFFDIYTSLERNKLAKIIWNVTEIDHKVKKIRKMN